ncbi:hypothetical protein EYF80_028941 [Liparis tanakae]|uniref:Uncharacterized protein n=1 Tax=Liparis tanakae TaxID=230148 RepID=A0A4Z2H7N5_9TELE|nr:hypothetical protein EYF80_028941 [Liparis tanakae]
MLRLVVRSSRVCNEWTGRLLLTARTCPVDLDSACTKAEHCVFGHRRGSDEPQDPSACHLQQESQPDLSHLSQPSMPRMQALGRLTVKNDIHGGINYDLNRPIRLHLGTRRGAGQSAERALFNRKKTEEFGAEKQCFPGELRVRFIYVLTLVFFPLPCYTEPKVFKHGHRTDQRGRTQVETWNSVIINAQTETKQSGQGTRNWI